ncbi:MAG: hypothetical protein H6657_00035 [Ardenticatenaceae bacterium]|nr:hypothetical protein [Ardenticatenaceae bacterium]
MSQTENGRNKDRVLADIPPEYQEAFRQAIAQELIESGQNQTDLDVLAFLRQRAADFKNGAFIRPDGLPGMLMLDAEARYELALPQLAQQSLSEGEETPDRRALLLKVGGLFVVALLLLFFALRSRDQRVSEIDVLETEGAATDVTASIQLPATLEPLPDIEAANETLQTIGTLGGALTIGRPSVLELHYQADAQDDAAEVIALAIDPSRSTPKGELRFNEAAMLSENPVAVWLFGTVLNYAIGVPDALIRNLSPGDKLVLHTDTGSALTFVVSEVEQAASYDALRLLSQNRLGLTLFALPAVAEEVVAVALATYDVTGETAVTQTLIPLGDSFSLGKAGQLQVTNLSFSHAATGTMIVLLEGIAADLLPGQTHLLSLIGNGVQTTAVPFLPDGSGRWIVTFSVPDSTPGTPLAAEFRTLPGGESELVNLGVLPALTNQLEATLTTPVVQPGADEMLVQIAVHNPGPGAVYLSDTYFQLIQEGGDVDEPFWQVTPSLPRLLEPGETIGFQLLFPSQAELLQLQIGKDLWGLASPP